MKKNPDSTLEREKTTEERVAELEERVRTLFVLACDYQQWREDHPEAAEAMKRRRDEFYVQASAEALDTFC